MSKVKGVENFKKEMEEILQRYEIEARSVLNETCPEAADICCKMIDQYETAEGRVKYGHDWKVQEQTDRRLGTVYVVHSPKHYRVAHLIENSHPYGWQNAQWTGDGKIQAAKDYAEDWLYGQTINELERLGVGKH